MNNEVSGNSAPFLTKTHPDILNWDGVQGPFSENGISKNSELIRCDLRETEFSVSA